MAVYTQVTTGQLCVCEWSWLEKLSGMILFARRKMTSHDDDEDALKRVEERDGGREKDDFTINWKNWSKNKYVCFVG